MQYLVHSTHDTCTGRTCSLPCHHHHHHRYPIWAPYHMGQASSARASSPPLPLGLDEPDWGNEQVVLGF